MDIINKVEQLMKLADTVTNEILLEAIAGNPGTPIKVVEKFAGHENKIVRIAVGKNKNTLTYYILKRLVSDEDNEVRNSVTGNKNTPINILERLELQAIIDIRSDRISGKSYKY